MKASDVLIFLALLMVLPPAVLATPALDELMPPEAEPGGWLGEMTFVNGLPTAAQVFVVDQPVEDVLAWYRDTWGAQAAESEISGWRQISALIGTLFVTAQLKPSSQHATLGRLVLTPLDKVRMPQRAAAMPDDATPIMDMDAPAGKTQGRLLIYQTYRTPDETAEWQINHWREDKLTRTQDAATADRQQRVIRMARGASAVQILIRADQGRTTVMVLETKGVNL